MPVDTECVSKYTRMSQEVCKSVGSVGYNGYNPNTPHLYISRFSFTKHLLISWDIQVYGILYGPFVRPAPSVVNGRNHRSLAAVVLRPVRLFRPDG